MSGLWRRLLALEVDALLLGVLGHVLAWPSALLLFDLGPYGRLVGFVVALAYFGVLDSRVGGQTPGKRLLKVAVRDGTGQPIGVGRSIVRTLIWLVPFTLNAWDPPIMGSVVVSWVASILALGVGGAVVLTLLFNRRSRQGVHDLLTRTYVVHLNGWPVETLPVAGRLPWVLSGAALPLLLLVGVLVLVPLSRFRGQHPEMVKIERTLQADQRFFSASVVDYISYEIGGDTSRELRIELWCKGLLTESEFTAAIDDIAGAALRMNDVDRFDLVRVEARSTWDLGFEVRGSVTHSDSRTVAAWRERLADRPGGPPVAR